MKEKKARHPRQETAARANRSSNGAADNHTTLTCRQTVGILAAGIAFAAMTAIAEWGFRAWA